MKMELYRAFKSITPENLNDDEKEELLQIFMIVKSSTIRNQIAFILSDVHYNRAIPFILSKINDKDLFNNNGSLVYALEGLNIQDYFLDIVKIICTMEYEARYQAYELIQKYAPVVADAIRKEAISVLEKNRLTLEKTAVDKGNNSMLHFVESTIEILAKFS